MTPRLRNTVLDYSFQAHDIYKYICTHRPRRSSAFSKSLFSMAFAISSVAATHSINDTSTIILPLRHITFVSESGLAFNRDKTACAPIRVAWQVTNRIILQIIRLRRQTRRNRTRILSNAEGFPPLCT